MRKNAFAKNLIFIVFLTLFFVSGIFAFFKSSVLSSSTDGTIDSVYKYAWSENTGWVNFGTSNGNVHITDSGLSGYALSENIGWIYLGDVVNDSNGNLSGYAWSENAGWIKFNPANGGVIINSSGEFTGSALGENIGWIVFGGDYKVKTDWRPASARGGAGLPVQYSSPPAPAAVSSGNPQGGFKIVINNEAEITRNRMVNLRLFAGADTARMAISNNPEFSGIGATGQMAFQPSYEWDICRGTEKCVDGNYTVYVKFYADWGMSSGIISDGIIYSQAESLAPAVPSVTPATPSVTPATPPATEEKKKPLIEKIKELLKPESSSPAFPEEIKPPEINIPEDIKPLPTAEEIKEIIPVLQVSAKPMVDILAEIKKESHYQIMESKFRIEKSFDGIFSALKEFGLELKQTPGNIKSFAVSIVKNPVFIAKDLSYALGEGSFIFAKSAFNFSKNVGRLAISQINNAGRRMIALRKSFKPSVVVKPEPSVISPEIAEKSESIIFNSVYGNIKLPQKDGNVVSLAGLGVKSFIKPKNEAVKSIKTEIYLQKMAVKDFEKINSSQKHSLLFNEAKAEEFVEFEENKAKFGEYPYVRNEQGIWEATMISPAFAGEYELKTTIEYQSGEELEIPNLMVVRVKGWVYYSHPKGQIRLGGVKAELYRFNDNKGLFELWPAGIYGQKNPQITDDSGEYAFLLPEGRYYLKVSKGGYLPFVSEEFQLKEPGILNQIITLSELEF